MIVSVANAEASEKKYNSYSKKDLKERAATFPYRGLIAGIGVTTVSAALTQIPSYQGVGPLEVAVFMGGMSALAFAVDGAASAIKAVSDVVNYEKNVETLKQYGLYKYAQRYAERIKEDYQKRDAPKVADEEKGMSI